MNTPIFDDLNGYEISIDYWETYWSPRGDFFSPPCAYDAEPDDAKCGTPAWDLLCETWNDFDWPPNV